MVGCLAFDLGGSRGEAKDRLDKRMVGLCNTDEAGCYDLAIHLKAGH